MPKTTHLNASTLEGGGQLLRLSLSLASLTNQPLHLTNIRGNRSGGGGLKQQHLTCVQWLSRAAGMETVGAEKKARDLRFGEKGGKRDKEGRVSEGREKRGGKGRDGGRGKGRTEEGGRRWGEMESVIDIGTPGAVGLVFQAIMPYILFAGATHSSSASSHQTSSSLSTSQPTKAPRSEPRAGDVDKQGDKGKHQAKPLDTEDLEMIHITIKGGTHVSNSPSADYLTHVLLPMLSHIIGLPPISAHCTSRGWSTGRTEMGSVTFSIPMLPLGYQLPAFTLTSKDRGEFTRIEARILGPRSSEKLIHSHLSTALSINAPVLSSLPLEVHFSPSHHDKRLYILLILHTSTGIRLGRDHLMQERFSTLEYGVKRVVERAVEGLLEEVSRGGVVDEFLEDQVVVFMALAGGRSFVGERSVVDNDDTNPGDKREAEDRSASDLRDGNSSSASRFASADDNPDKPISGPGNTIAGGEPSLHTQTARWVAEEVVGARFDERGGCEGIGWFVGQKWDGRKRRRDGGDEFGVEDERDGEDEMLRDGMEELSIER